MMCMKKVLVLFVFVSGMIAVDSLMLKPLNRKSFEDILRAFRELMSCMRSYENTTNATTAMVQQYIKHGFDWHNLTRASGNTEY